MFYICESTGDVYKKVVDNFISFPESLGGLNLDVSSSRYDLCKWYVVQS